MEDYKTLYHELLEEHQRLQNEVNYLKKLTALIPANIQDGEVRRQVMASPITQTAKITRFSSPEAKISLFMSLFKGRGDIYAKRFYNQKNQQSGYAPVCANRGDKRLCNFKCKTCSFKVYEPLTASAIRAHLQGKDKWGQDVIGIYPLLEDEMCWFLAVDFDKKQWKEDVSAFRQVCQELGVPVYVERSRSGEGAHCWFFFSEKIPAPLARRLGNALLTQTMESYHQLKLSSYDRLFPNQDSRPKGGFGNLIALPLQGAAMTLENSKFIDADFSPYPDQWSLLGSVKRLTLSDVQQLLDQMKCHELGDLLNEKEEANPWEKQLKPTQLSQGDFPKTVKIVQADLIYIEKEGLSSQALNRIKRLAAFRNPEYYKMQANRLSTYQTPRIIDCSEQFDKYVGIPRGCFSALLHLVEETGAKVEIKRETTIGIPVAVRFDGKLRYEQELAAAAMLDYPTGVLSAVTGFGKTVLASYLITSRKVNTLILVHTTALLTQWRESLEKHLTFEESLVGASSIGQLGGGKNKLSGLIDVATIQSLSRQGEVKDLVKDYGMVIVDECHHLGAKSFEQVLRKVTATYVYGLSATPTRRDGATPIIFMQLGPIRFRTDAKIQAVKRSFKHFLVPKFTNFNLPRHLDEQELSITDIYGALIENENRNGRILTDIRQALADGRHPLVLTGRKAHVEILANKLSEICSHVIVLVGGESVKKKREALERLQTIPVEEPFVIVATGKYVGEGFDFPRLDTLFLTMPISWEGSLNQYAGRLHREFEGKKEVIIYDYIDIHVKMLERMYHKRSIGYTALGYVAKCESENPEKAGLLFDHTNFLVPLKLDLSQSQQEIVIVSPFVLKSRVQSISQLLLPLTMKNVSVYIVTRPVSDYEPSKQHRVAELLNLLKSYSFKVTEKTGIHQKFLIIDRRITWYGSLNLLSYGKKSEETMMRFENQGIAQELLESWE